MYTEIDWSEIPLIKEDVYTVTMKVAIGCYGKPTYKQGVIIVEYYHTSLFDIGYVVKKGVRNVISVSSGRGGLDILYDTQLSLKRLLTAQEKDILVSKFLHKLEEEKIQMLREIEEYHNTGNCVSCKLPQKHVTMPLDKHFCSVCKSYLNFVIHQIEAKIITSHQIIKEKRLARKEGKWKILVFANEVKNIDTKII